MWRRAWVDGVDHYIPWMWSPDTFRLVQNHGRGLLIQGTREWTDIQVAAELKVHLAAQAGVAVRVQGMTRYYALLLGAGERVRLVKVLDGEKVLGEAHFTWDYYQRIRLCLQVVGNCLQGWVDDQLFFEVYDEEASLDGGGIAIVCEDGCISCGPVDIHREEAPS